MPPNPSNEPAAAPSSLDEMDQWLLLCRVLGQAGVPFLVVGAFGAEVHLLHDANFILTRDMDLLLPCDRAALARAFTALQQSGFDLFAGGEPLVRDDAILEGVIRAKATVRATRQRENIDLMLGGIGLEFDELYLQRREFVFLGQPLPVAPLEAILRSKRLANRLKDGLFLEQFREVVEEALERDRQRDQRSTG
jgi:hypothetical protein